jgi:Spy/CpxP family protein refolding chaperone
VANLESLKNFLGLTDAQVQQLKDLRKTQSEALKPYQEQIQEKRKALAEEMQKTSPSAAVAGQLMVDIKKIREEMKAKAGDRSTAVRAVLTDAQKAKLPELEAAQKLGPAVREAAAVGLLTPPAGQAGGFGVGPGGPRARGWRAGRPSPPI